MTRTIISVTEYPSMRGRYLVRCDAMKDKRGMTYPYDVSGAAAAAARAMDYAARVGSRGYVIFAPSSVLALIPADMRERA